MSERLRWIESSQTFELPLASPEFLSQLSAVASEEALAASSQPLPLFSVAAWQSILQHLEADPNHERLGLLLGRVHYAQPWQRILVEVQVALPAPVVRSNPHSVAMLEQSWPALWVEAAHFPHLQWVGWFHSHPGHGIFLSAQDRSAQQRWFRQPWQLAVVVDPLNKEYGVFAGEEGIAVAALSTDLHRWPEARHYTARIAPRTADAATARSRPDNPVRSGTR
jgi:proteasome lid subunit RPN8/RPN11